MRRLPRFVGMLLFRFIYPFLLRAFFFIFLFVSRTPSAVPLRTKCVLLPVSFIGIWSHCQTKWKMPTGHLKGEKKLFIQHFSWNRTAQSHITTANSFEQVTTCPKWRWIDAIETDDIQVLLSFHKAIHHSFNRVWKSRGWRYWNQWIIIVNINEFIC